MAGNKEIQRAELNGTQGPAIDWVRELQIFPRAGRERSMNDRERACFRLALSSENNTDTPTPV